MKGGSRFLRTLSPSCLARFVDVRHPASVRVAILQESFCDVRCNSGTVTTTATTINQSMSYTLRISGIEAAAPGTGLAVGAQATTTSLDLGAPATPVQVHGDVRVDAGRRVLLGDRPVATEGPVASPGAMTFELPYPAGPPAPPDVYRIVAHWDGPKAAQHGLTAILGGLEAGAETHVTETTAETSHFRVRTVHATQPAPSQPSDPLPTTSVTLVGSFSSSMQAAPPPGSSLMLLGLLTLEAVAGVVRLTVSMRGGWPARSVDAWAVYDGTMAAPGPVSIRLAIVDPLAAGNNAPEPPASVYVYRVA